MTKRIFIMIASLLLCLNTLGKIVATLSEVNKPLQIVFNEDKFFVIEKTTIFMYSLNNYKLIKKIGKRGEGPGEFALITSVIPYKDNLLINSLGKILFFKKNGDFRNEKKVNSTLIPGGTNLYPLKNGFVGSGVTAVGKVIYKTINLFDSNLKKIKELNRILISSKNKIVLQTKSFLYKTNNNKIFISSRNGLSIDVLNGSGKKMNVITYQNYQRRIFDQKKTILDKMKKKNKFKYKMLKDRLEFPEFYPEILNFFVSDKKVHIVTWKWQNKKIEVFIFTIKGKLLKHTFIPVVLDYGVFVKPYPLTIYNNNLYQIVENEKKEVWEFHVNTIK